MKARMQEQALKSFDELLHRIAVYTLHADIADTITNKVYTGKQQSEGRARWSEEDKKEVSNAYNKVAYSLRLFVAFSCQYQAQYAEFPWAHLPQHEQESHQQHFALEWLSKS